MSKEQENLQKDGRIAIMRLLRTWEKLQGLAQNSEDLPEFKEIYKTLAGHFLEDFQEIMAEVFPGKTLEEILSKPPSSPEPPEWLLKFKDE